MTESGVAKFGLHPQSLMLDLCFCNKDKENTTIQYSFIKEKVGVIITSMDIVHACNLSWERFVTTLREASHLVCSICLSA